MFALSYPLLPEHTVEAGIRIAFASLYTSAVICRHLAGKAERTNALSEAIEEGTEEKRLNIARKKCIICKCRICWCLEHLLRHGDIIAKWKIVAPKCVVAIGNTANMYTLRMNTAVH